MGDAAVPDLREASSARPEGLPRGASATPAEISEGRWAFQVRLGDALRLLVTPDEVETRACQMLGEHLGVNRAHLAEIQGDNFVILARYLNGVCALPERGPVATFGAGPLESFIGGEPATVEDVDRDPRLTSAERATLRAIDIAAFAAVKLTREGRWVGLLGVHSATPRVWTPNDVTTMLDVADRIWTFAERTKAEAALRESEARYAAMFENSPIGKALIRWSDRTTVTANPTLLRTLELRAEEVIGKPSVDLGISTPETQATLQLMLESRGRVRDFECLQTSKAGAERILSLNLDWIVVNGERHVLTTVRDLTDLRRAEGAARLHEQQRLVEQARAEALRHSEARYSGILQTSADAIVTVDEQQRITFFNQAAKQTFGYAPEEVLGAPLDILIPERFRAVHREHVAHFAAGHQSSRLLSERDAELYGRRKDGEEFPADATISKVTVDGETILTAVMRDITAKRRSEVEQRLLSEVSKALAVSIDEEELALTTLTTLPVREFAELSSLYLMAGDGSVHRRAIACRDPARQPLLELIRNVPIERHTLHPLWKLIDTRRSLLMQLAPTTFESFALSEGHQHALEVLNLRSTIGVPLLVGDRVLGAFFLSSCWPSRAFDGRDLELVEEVARRTALSLENARLYRAAQQAVRARDEVLAVVAHDLRNPLGAILLNATLTRPRPGRPERRSQRPAEVIERTVLHMSHLIDDLLDVTRMESGHLELDRMGIAPASLLVEAVESHRPQAFVEAIAIESEAPPDLPLAWADKARIEQVFQNLIGNAIRATPRGRISLSARVIEGQILFSVADTGRGIASEDLPHVFDRFWQARNTRRGGAGLGLSIVKSIVEAHGGRIWIESESGAGTTVYFTLPVAAPERREVPPDTERRRAP